MDLLAQHLKGLDSKTFHQLCFQLLAEKYPSANIRYVEGASGDEGLDLFRGDLACGPTIWQCKSFEVNLIRESQKNQIRKSLRRAVTCYGPTLWVLCLNMDFDSKAHLGFQRRAVAAGASSMRKAHGQDCADRGRLLRCRFRLMLIGIGLKR